MIGTKNSAGKRSRIGKVNYMLKKEQHDTPLVTIITPSYNAERFIQETMESAVAQTFINWEMIIVDDCSKDRTVDIIKQYQKQEQRIKLIQLTKNSGAAVARNMAIEHSKGRFLAFLDSDDLWLPEKLEKQLDFMQKNHVAFSYSQYVTMDENGETGSIVPCPRKVTYKQLLKQNVIGCLTVMLDKEKIGTVKMENIRSRQDYVLWLTLLKNGHQAYGMQEVLSKYRLGHNSLSKNKIKMAKQNWQVYREIEELDVFKSFLVFSPLCVL